MWSLVCCKRDAKAYESVFFDLEEEVKTDPSMTLKDLVHLQLEMSVGKNLSFDIPSLESPFNEKD